MGILRIYVAAVCLASTVFGLYEAPLLLRARQRAAHATLREREWRAAVQLAHARSRAEDAALAAVVTADPMKSDEESAKSAEWMAVGEKSQADDVYEVQKVYALLIGGVFLTHALLLLIATRRRRNRSPSKVESSAPELTWQRWMNDNNLKPGGRITATRRVAPPK